MAKTKTKENQLEMEHMILKKCLFLNLHFNQDNLAFYNRLKSMFEHLKILKLRITSSVSRRGISIDPADMMAKRTMNRTKSRGRFLTAGHVIAVYGK